MTNRTEFFQVDRNTNERTNISSFMDSLIIHRDYDAFVKNIFYDDECDIISFKDKNALEEFISILDKSDLFPAASDDIDIGRHKSNEEIILYSTDLFPMDFIVALYGSLDAMPVFTDKKIIENAIADEKDFKEIESIIE